MRSRFPASCYTNYNVAMFSSASRCAIFIFFSDNFEWRQVVRRTLHGVAIGTNNQTAETENKNREEKTIWTIKCLTSGNVYCISSVGMLFSVHTSHVDSLHYYGDDAFIIIYYDVAHAKHFKLSFVYK